MDGRSAAPVAESSQRGGPAGPVLTHGGKHLSEPVPFSRIPAPGVAAGVGGRGGDTQRLTSWALRPALPLVRWLCLAVSSVTETRATRVALRMKRRRAHQVFKLSKLSLVTCLCRSTTARPTLPASPTSRPRRPRCSPATVPLSRQSPRGPSPHPRVPQAVGPEPSTRRRRQPPQASGSVP